MLGPPLVQSHKPLLLSCMIDAAQNVACPPRAHVNIRRRIIVLIGLMT